MPDGRVSAPRRAPPVEHPEVRSAIDLLEAWIEAQRVARELPGVSLGIVHDQALVWSGGFGWADVERREPATADTDPLLAPSTLKPVGEHTFRVETTDGYGIPGELVVFETDPAGRVRRARFGENYTERIETWEDR